MQKAESTVPSLDGDPKIGKKLSEIFEPGHVQPERHEYYAYDHLGSPFPVFHWDELKDIPYEHKGLHGDPRFRDLLDAAEDVFDYIRKIGTEISGIKMTQLTAAQKCDLARLIVTSRVVFFRNQEDFDIEAQKELGKFFGTLHRHATTSMPQKEGVEDHLHDRPTIGPTCSLYPDVFVALGSGRGAQQEMEPATDK
ncbi:hypothetical protein AYL99_00933 [Fonsecaea erecta]|uniref:TauD/TfdA-like domain-containing protein n=1 Tax=Fonsecaea erecta TaxID=1367422 RepID=A0A179A038_9EURO|nr:hypothetical protein AYL99_00933 [Fonsecaea erecta]OAP64961.1 hypothetical protein AYL99_00933 [Fonsecaea erecta]